MAGHSDRPAPVRTTVYAGDVLSTNPICRIALLFLVGVAFPASAQETHLNIVLIISDDQAWSDYGFMGHPHIKTPHLDKLARESLTFTRGYVPSSLCRASLASIVTGLFPHQHKITSNDPPLPPGVTRRGFGRSPAFAQGREVMNRHLEAVPTLPRMLGKLGYRSFQSGKWWQGYPTVAGKSCSGHFLPVLTVF